jgi:hypothetical protein
VIYAAVDVVRGFGNEQERPDLAALISSGLLSQCLGTVAAFETRGTASVRDTCHITLYYMLSIVRSVVSEPGCEAQIRGVASALAFALEHDLPALPEFGATTGAITAAICAGVFGRDEEGSTFCFTQGQVDTLCIGAPYNFVDPNNGHVECGELAS